MRIGYLAAGAAGMYCGACLHDNTLAAALLDLGEDVVLAPIYTPLRTDETDVSVPRVFIGGINAYLQQHIPLLRRTPRWLDGWLDSPRLLRLVARRGVSVDAAKLGPMTVSMLQGEQGAQRKELDKLVDWLIDEVRPDVVRLSNAMMVGLARRIAEKCGPPVVCSLAGEDIFLEKLPAPYYQQARALLRERIADVDALTALNQYYARRMGEYLSVSPEKIRVIPHGLNLAGHGDRTPRRSDAPQRVGYLARVCADKGLHLLVDACAALASRRGTPIELHAAGYLGAADRRYLDDLQRKAATGPLAGRFTYHGELSREQKIAFLQSLDVFSTPTIYAESKGLPLLEAWANGVPAAVPDHGAFPELVTAAGAGVLHRPGDAESLAEALAELLDDPQRAAALGRAGLAYVQTHHDARKMAERTLALYRELVGGVKPAGVAAGT